MLDYFKEKDRITELKDIEADRPQGLNKKIIMQYFKSYSVALRGLKSLYPKEYVILESKDKEPPKEEKLDPLEALRASTTEKTYE